MCPLQLLKSAPRCLPVRRSIRSTNCLLMMAVGLVALSGCRGSESPSEREAPVPVARPLPSADAGAAVGNVLTKPTEKRFEGITLTIPAGWEERPLASEFVQAEYQVPGDGGPARMTLSSAGGGIEPNLERWQGQFQRGPDDPAPARTAIAVDGVEAVLIELHGTFSDGFRGGDPQRNWSMLGAIIPTGPANFFLKLTGPKETIAARREEFRAVVSSARLGR
jgi:hypothetical protein